ncbi:hypothetical protein BC629DRAFT_650511 [Irpex lacteus]|nr:hypothetical protein BC629DRAFT_650511 [Irpex lacteus]
MHLHNLVAHLPRHLQVNNHHRLPPMVAHLRHQLETTRLQQQRRLPAIQTRTQHIGLLTATTSTLLSSRHGRLNRPNSTRNITRNKGMLLLPTEVHPRLHRVMLLLRLPHLLLDSLHVRFSLLPTVLLFFHVVGRNHRCVCLFQSLLSWKGNHTIHD